jgi:O-antigen ligase
MYVSDATPTWWRPETASGRSASPEGGVAFTALVTFTVILLLSPQVWFPVLQNFRIAFLAAGLAIVIYLLECTLRRQSVGPLRPEFVIALFLVGWAALTAPLSYWPGGSVGQLIDPFLKAVVFFWLIGTLVTTYGRLRLFMWVLVLCSIPLSVSALQSYRAGDFLLTPEDTAPRIAGFIGGGSGLAGNPNDLALTLNLMIPVAAALFTVERALAARAVAGLALVLSVAGVIVTFSRAGFVTLVVIGVLSLALMVRRAPAGALVVLLALGLSTPWILPSGYVQRLTTITDISSDPTGSAQGRWTDLTVAFDVASRSPVIGVGLGQNVLALNRERGPTWRTVHNVYLQYAVDLGLPGLLLFLSLFVTVFRCVRRVVRLSRRKSLIEVGIVAESVQIALCAFAVAALFYPVAYHFYFFLIAGLALAVANVFRTTLSSSVETEASA